MRLAHTAPKARAAVRATASGRRVQTHPTHRSRGVARHENVVPHAP